MVEYQFGRYGLCPKYLGSPPSWRAAFSYLQTGRATIKKLQSKISRCLLEIKHIILQHIKNLPKWYKQFEKRINILTKIEHGQRSKPFRNVNKFEQLHHTSLVKHALHLMIWLSIPLWKAANTPKYVHNFIHKLQFKLHMGLCDIVAFAKGKRDAITQTIIPSNQTECTQTIEPSTREIGTNTEPCDVFDLPSDPSRQNFIISYFFYEYFYRPGCSTSMCMPSLARGIQSMKKMEEWTRTTY